MSCKWYLMQWVLCNSVLVNPVLSSPTPQFWSLPALTSVSINNQMSPIGQAAADSRLLKVNNFLLKINIFVTSVKAFSLKMCLNGQSNRALFQATWILTMLTFVSFPIVRKLFIRDGEFWRLILLLSRKPPLHHPLFTVYHRQWLLFNCDDSGTLKQEKCGSNNQTMSFCCAKGKGAQCA